MKRINMRKHVCKGKLITFCGLDGSGKTTMIELLKRDFVCPVITKQPTKAVRQSEIFRNYMDCAEHEGFEYRSLSLLAASDRIQHSNQVILPELEKGKIVISDRYYYSCLANLRARGYVQDQWIYEIASFLPEPDLAVFVDVPVNVAIRRVRGRENEKDSYIDIALQEQLREEYLSIAAVCNGLVIDGTANRMDNLERIRRRMALWR